MFILILIFYLHVLDNNDEMIHRHKMLNSSNNRKSKFLSQFNLYVLKKSSNFANEEKTKTNEDTNKINKFKYFEKNLVVF